MNNNINQELLNLGSDALRKAALSQEAKEFLLSNEALFNTMKRAANRYIGGETLEEAIEKVKIQQAAGYKCSMEFMGESTSLAQEANQATDEFVRICQEIGKQQLHSTVSLDLSHIGLAVSTELGYQNLAKICSEAAKHGIEVIISAEEVERTNDIIATYKKAVKQYDNVSVTLQAYLYRTKDDLAELIKERGRIRIVKGAFAAAEGHSMRRGEALDQAYLGYVEQLLAQNHLCSIATHHDKIQQEVKKMIAQHQPNPATYEFESLYGIQAEQLAALKKEGYPTKVYFVYGKEWYLYLCNRIAEYPLNLFRALNDIVG